MSKKYERIAIVTGATSGIGEAVARKFINAGFGVVGNGRNAGKLAELEKEIGPAFLGVPGDASDKKVIDTLFKGVSEHFDAEPTIVIANAGRGLGGPVSGADLAQFEEVLRINVSGAAILIQKAAQRLVEIQKDGFPKTAADIIVIGSVVGRHISPFSAVYGASKFAVHALAEGLRREIGPKGVRVSTVAPGLVISGFQDVAGYSDELVGNFHKNFGPLLVGDDIADAIYHIVSLPPHIHISDMVVRPTRQDYP